MCKSPQLQSEPAISGAIDGWKEKGSICGFEVGNLLPESSRENLAKCEIARSLRCPKVEGGYLWLQPRKGY
jgi:hypothetical protein